MKKKHSPAKSCCPCEPAPPAIGDVWIVQEGTGQKVLHFVADSVIAWSDDLLPLASNLSWLGVTSESDAVLIDGVNEQAAQWTTGQQRYETDYGTPIRGDIDPGKEIMAVSTIRASLHPFGAVLSWLEVDIGSTPAFITGGQWYARTLARGGLSSKFPVGDPFNHQTAFAGAGLAISASTGGSLLVTQYWQQAGDNWRVFWDGIEIAQAGFTYQLNSLHILGETMATFAGSFSPSQRWDNGAEYIGGNWPNTNASTQQWPLSHGYFIDFETSYDIEYQNPLVLNIPRVTPNNNLPGDVGYNPIGIVITGTQTLNFTGVIYGATGPAQDLTVPASPTYPLAAGTTAECRGVNSWPVPAP